MKTLRDVPLRQVPVVEPSMALDEVVDQMEADPLRTVVLVGDGQYMGMFNGDALDSSLIPPGADLSTLTVGPYVHPMRAVGERDMPVETALTVMDRRNVDVLPVVDNLIFRGVVTRPDLEAALKP